MEKSAKWEPIENLDYARRSPIEWANIYGVELIKPFNDGRVWSEYEWAYFFVTADYRPLYEKGKEYDYDKLSEMELRAIELRRDVFYGASVGEKEILNEKFIETEWCRRRLNVL